MFKKIRAREILLFAYAIAMVAELSLIIFDTNFAGNVSLLVVFGAITNFTGCAIGFILLLLWG